MRSLCRGRFKLLWPVTDPVPLSDLLSGDMCLGCRSDKSPVLHRGTYPERSRRQCCLRRRSDVDQRPLLLPRAPSKDQLRRISHYTEPVPPTIDHCFRGVQGQLAMGLLDIHHLVGTWLAFDTSFFG